MLSDSVRAGDGLCSGVAAHPSARLTPDPLHVRMNSHLRHRVSPTQDAPTRLWWERRVGSPRNRPGVAVSAVPTVPTPDGQPELTADRW